MEENLDEANSEKWIVIQVTSGEKQWRIRQSYDSLHRMDKQLHSCIFKRTFSLLPELNKDLIEEEGSIVRMSFSLGVLCCLTALAQVRGP